MKIAIIGGTGTLSRSLVNVTYHKGWDITIINRGNHLVNIPPSVEIVKTDIFGRQIAKMLDGKTFDVVIDFVSRRPEDIDKVFPLFASRCIQYVFISTACVYRRADQDMPIKENSVKPNENWDYNIEKYECEKSLIKLCKQFSIKYTIIRPYITYDDERIPFGIAPAYRYHRTIIERIKHGKPMFIWGDGQTPTTATYVEDFSKALVGLIANKKAYNEAFHITSNRTNRIIDVLNELYKNIGAKPEIVEISPETICKEMPNYAGMMKGDRMLPAIFDNSKICQVVTDAHFDTTLEMGVKKILNYYNHLQLFEYDYQFEGQIDRLLSKVGVDCKFIKYPGDINKNAYLIYCIFRYLPYKVAIRLKRITRL